MLPGYSDRSCQCKPDNYCKVRRNAQWRRAKDPDPAEGRGVPAQRCKFYEPATITSSFLTDFTPGTPEATFAALSRFFLLFAVP